MKKERSLEKIVLRYSGAAAALLGGHAAHAQSDIIRTVVDTVLDKNGEHFDIDLDTNGVVDFRITQSVDSNLNDVTGVRIHTRGAAANQVLGLDYGNYNYPFRLNVGDTIEPNQAFKGTNPQTRVGYMGVSVNGTTYPNSEFVGGVTDGFLGVRFQGGVDTVPQTHYGWIRVDVAADLRSVTIHDFAFVTTPDSMIQAGHGSPIGVEEVEHELPEIAQRGKFLDIRLPESFDPTAEVLFYELSGKLVSKQEIAERKESISLENFPKGVLVAVVHSNGVQASKKVLVY